MVTLNRDNQVEFRFFRPQARQVYLVGDFNGWNRTRTPMTRLPDGEWAHQATLHQGSYHFKYLADGDWFLDYAAFGLEEGPFGWNSVVVVEPAPLPSRRKHQTAA
jgi:1,4-alpha-glucan branching enzyme